MKDLDLKLSCLFESKVICNNRNIYSFSFCKMVMNSCVGNIGSYCIIVEVLFILNICFNSKGN